MDSEIIKGLARAYQQIKEKLRESVSNWRAPSYILKSDALFQGKLSEYEYILRKFKDS